jgi:hypothetical protein
MTASAQLATWEKEADAARRVMADATRRREDAEARLQAAQDVVEREAKVVHHLRGVEATAVLQYDVAKRRVATVVAA